MTNEEAIKIINIKNLKHGDKILVECTVEGVFVNSGMVMVTTRDCNKGFDAYIDEIKSVTLQQPKIGHWISHREHCEMNNLRPSGLGSYFWCSECDCGIDSKYFHRVNYKYCPNCGCRMPEREDKK